jgi:DHA1 family bicyclomycin/chloramphenicol resistance-like MFS transporter
MSSPFCDSEPPPNRGATTSIRLVHLLMLGGMSALGALATDMYLPALPLISRDLSATMAQTQLTLSAGILGLALGQIIAGPSSDAVGRRRPLLIGLAAFALASLLCLVAPSIGALTLLRFVQGLAGAAGIALALAIVSDLYTGVTQARFFALLMGTSGLAPIIAPLIGSQLLTVTTWHGIFVTLALISVGLLLAVAWGLGETLPPVRRQRGGLAASLRTFGQLLTDRRFLGYALAGGFAVGAGITYISGSPFLLQHLYGVSPQRVGLIFGINALGLVFMTQLSGRLVGRLSPQALLGWGVAMMAVGGFALLAVVLAGVGLAGILAALFVTVSSMGLIMPNATALALADMQSAGSASALVGVLQLSIGAIVAPLVGLAGSTSALPMALAIVLFAVATLLTFLLFCRPGPEQSLRQAQPLPHERA